VARALQHVPKYSGSSRKRSLEKGARQKTIGFTDKFAAYKKWDSIFWPRDA
jgi:hypothetical protein